MSAENEIRNIKLFEEEIRNIKQMAFDAAHPINETYTQYPQQDDPMTLYNKDGVTSVWEIQSQYSGAFFRSSNAPEAVYKADDEDEYYIRDTVTGALLPINASANGGPSISSTPSGSPIVIEGKEYKRYEVTADSRNAADYINKTNLLNIQNQATAKNGLSLSNTLKLRSVNADTGGSDDTTSSGGAWAFDFERGTYNMNLFTAVTNTSIGNGNNGTREVDSSSNTSMKRIRVSGSAHAHNIYLRGSVSLGNGDTETRPDNYTLKIWKRIS